MLFLKEGTTLCTFYPINSLSLILAEELTIEQFSYAAFPFFIDISKAQFYLLMLKTQYII